MEEKNFPLVSIGIPTYNRADDLPKSVESALAQDYPNIEIIISDNGSTDHTKEVCEQLVQKDSRIKYHRIPVNIGPYPNFQNALEHAQGKYFMWLDDDDALVPNIVSVYSKFMEQNPEYVTVCGEIHYYGEGKLQYKESGLSLEQNSPKARVSYYYRKVVQGALWHGLHRRYWIADIPIRNDLAGDWHFIAGVAYRGKIHNLPVHGYNKDYEGVSTTNWGRWMGILGINKGWSIAPFGRIAFEAFRDITYKSHVYKKMNGLGRFMLGTKCAFFILAHYYLVFWPKIIGGKLLRFLKLPTPSSIREKKTDGQQLAAQQNN